MHTTGFIQMSLRSAMNRCYRCLAFGLCLPALGSTGIADHQWCRITSPHFNLVTDIDPKGGVELARALEGFHRMALQLLHTDQEQVRPLRVLAFKNKNDFRKTFDNNRIAGFMKPSFQEHLLVFGPDEGARGRFQVAFHEYTHYLLRRYSSLNLPIWFEEGFAVYLSTAQFETSVRAVVGQPVVTPNIRRILNRRPRVGQILDERYTVDWSRHVLPGVYEKAWAIVHFLYHGKNPENEFIESRVEDMLVAIDAGMSSADAIKTYTGYNSTDLAVPLRAYFLREELPVRNVEFESVSPEPLDVDCLSPREARLSLARIVMAQNPLLAGRFLEDVLEDSPDDVPTLVSYSQALRGLRGKAYTIAERALGLDPSDVGANVRMAELIVSRCMEDIAALCRRNWDDAATLYRTALELDPERVDAAFGLGVVYVHTGKPGDAINYLRVAHRLAPWAPRINYYLGEAYRLTGNEALAKLHLKKTYHWDASEDWRKRARISLSLLSLPY